MVSFLLFFFMIAMLVGQSAMDGASVLLAVVMIFKAWEWKQQRNPHYRLFNKKGFDVLFVLWFVIVGAGFYFAKPVDNDWIKYIIEFKWILFFYIINAALIFRPIREEHLFWLCSIFATACVYAIAVAFLKYDPVVGDLPSLFGDHGAFSRTGGLYSDSMTFAHCYGLLLCVFIGWSLTYSQWSDPRKYLVWFVTLIGAVAILFSFTRGVWLALAVAGIFMAFVYSKRVALLLLGTIGGLGALAFNYWPEFQERVMYSFTEKNYDQKRWHLWQANWEIIKDNWVVGVGYGENKKMLPALYEKLGITDQTIVSHAHNQYIHWLAGTGILGLVCILSIYICFLVFSYRKFKDADIRKPFERGIALGVFGAQICLIVGGLFEANMEHSKVKFVISFLWALL